MDEEIIDELIRRYQRDRRLLLNLILSGNLIKEIVMPPGAVSLKDVDLEQVSVDHVLSCAAKGALLELSPATRSYHGSTRSPQNERELIVDDIEDFGDDHDHDEGEDADSENISRSNPNDAHDLPPRLPSFATGITNDDLRETAYELLLACAGTSGGLTIPSKVKKRGKRYALMRKLGRRGTEKVLAQSQRAPGLVGLLETMRVQMEISEEFDRRTRQGLLDALSGKEGKKMDSLLVPLELLCCIPHTEFSNDKAYIRWQKRQLKMLKEGLINHPAVEFGEFGDKAEELKFLLEKIEESEALHTDELQRTESLQCLREAAIPLAERPAMDGLAGKVCHWADGYHLNIKLYEQLLLSVFDMLEEEKLIQCNFKANEVGIVEQTALNHEVDKVIELLHSTWHVLGITETIHYTFYAWVLFRQFVITKGHGMLQQVTEQLKEIPLKNQRDPQEQLRLRSLHAAEGEEDLKHLSFFHSFLSPIQKWVDKQLEDYHINFSELSRSSDGEKQSHFTKSVACQGSETMADIITTAVLVQQLLQEEYEEKSTFFTEWEQIELYISSSIKNAFSRILEKIETTDAHPLAVIADKTTELLNKDWTMFMPILSQRHPQASVASASLVHKLYGNNLKPFLECAEHLTEDVVSVFMAAENLEQNVMAQIASVFDEATAEIYCRKLNPYQIESVSGKLVSRWINLQHEKILSWVERAIQQEKWEPISLQQRHGSSIVEVFRITEENVNQFFDLKVPMRSTELDNLFQGINNVFQVYRDRVTDNLGSKEDLIPPVPSLARYKKKNVIKKLVKKELFETKLYPDEQTRTTEANLLSTHTLCIQLNTLHYALGQLNELEDSIWDRWTEKYPKKKMNIEKSLDVKARKLTQNGTLEGSRKAINAAMDRLSDYAGTKIVFSDLRKPFIENLYKPSVSESRLEAVIETLDMELSQLCDIITESLRDHIVTSLLRASVDGLLRVLLDGGPSRVFLPNDAELLVEDMEIFKEFFICGGDGLPREVVENFVARVEHVIILLGCETQELIENLRATTHHEMEHGKSHAGSESKTLLRILCHRADSEASRFLKKQYKIPKYPS